MILNDSLIMKIPFLKRKIKLEVCVCLIKKIEISKVLKRISLHATKFFRMNCSSILFFSFHLSTNDFFNTDIYNFHHCYHNIMIWLWNANFIKDILQHAPKIFHNNTNELFCVHTKLLLDQTILLPQGGKGYKDLFCINEFLAVNDK